MNDTGTIRRTGAQRVVACAVAALVLALWLLTQNGVKPQQPQAFSDVLATFAVSMPVLGAIWIGAAGYGYALRLLFLPGRGSRVIEELALGIAGLLMVNWLAAWAGWLTQNAGVAVFGAGCLLNLLKFLPTKDEGPRERRGLVVPWSVLLLVPGLALLLVAACCPPGSLWRVEAYGYDVTSYHLQLPREWIAAGRMSGLEHNVYSFLPSLIESGYALIGLLSGSVVEAVYTCQLFHVTLTLLAAAAIGKTVAAKTTAAVGVGAAGLFLALPWVTITGSMAYNEMGVLAFGSAALLVIFGEAGTTPRGAMAAGLLVGAATLAKLTAGVMVAVPVGLILLLRLNRRGHSEAGRKKWVDLQLPAIAALAGALMLTPYFARNYTWTGNPVFPFAAERLGAGHWDAERVDRWDTAHGLSPKQEGRLDALGRQWLFNTGYGAVGGQPTPREMQNVARFETEGGVPTLWIVVAVGGVLLLIHKDTRRFAGGLLLMLGMQVLFWMFATHMQSRFLLPTVLPAGLIVGLGYGRLVALTKQRAPTVAPVVGSALVVTLGLISFATLISQTRTVRDPANGEVLQTPLWVAVNAQITTHPDALDTHPINRLPENSKTLLVADNSGLLYLRRPFLYATAFDDAPLGKIIRETGGIQDDPARVNQALRSAGVTHIWVHWSELARLHGTYGHDPDVTEQTLSRLIATGWQTLETVGRSATLYALPAQE